MRAAEKFNGTALPGRVAAAQVPLSAMYVAYRNASQTASWHTLGSCAFGHGEQVICAGITKGEFGELYSSGMVNGVDAARDVYDEILVSAGGKCPYCGGIGYVGGLDHYLPKARYPAYSVLPINLVPSCERCNRLSGSPVFNEAEDQTINPYFDHQRFFEDPWIFVIFEGDQLLGYRYTYNPPLTWPDIAKLRAKRHFEDFDLAVRYGTAAGGEVGYLNDLKASLVGKIGSADFRNLLMTKANSSNFDVNGWQRPLYRAIAHAAWFLAEFNDA